MAVKRGSSRAKATKKSKETSRSRVTTTVLKRKPAPHDPLDDFVDAAAHALALPLDPAWRPSIRTNLAVTLSLAALFGNFPLPDEAEPAPVFVA